MLLMKRFLILALTTFALIGHNRAQSAPAKQPNFVIIFADDLGYGDVGYQGGDVPTPNIDSIAENGTVFSDGYVTCPVCAPSRAGMLTGKYQQSFGFWDNIGPYRVTPETQPGIPVDLPILSERLKPLGYATGLFGKTHDGDAEEMMAFNRWDEFYGFNNGASNYLGDMNRLHNPIFHNKQIVSDPYSQRGIDHKDINHNGSLIRDLENHLTDELANHAVKFIEDNKDNPFLCYVPFNAIHGPFQAPKPIVDKYAHIEDEKRRTVMAMIDSMDQNIGKVLAALRDNNLEENTLVIFLSDNGGHEASISLPLRGKKATYWEGGLRVPFCAQWKGVIPAGVTYSDPVISLDILPTLVTAAGGKIDSEWQLDGVDLMPFITGQKKAAPHDALYWVWGARKAIRQGDLKAITENEGNTWHLYNLRKDLAEENDLAAIRPEKLKELIDRHQQWEKDLTPQQWGWNKTLGHEDPNFGKPKPYHDPNYFKNKEAAVPAKPSAAPPTALKLNGVFSDHMVLQRNHTIPIFGAAAPGSEVSVTLGQAHATATADDQGHWRAELPSREASSQSLDLSISSGSQSLHLQDLIIGDIWVCSGQSNMGWGLSQTEPLPDNYRHADKLRLLEGKVVSAESPQSEFIRDDKHFIDGWQRATEEHALELSAVSYYMGREIVAQSNVPVGLIVVALGGTQIWPWMTPDSFIGHPEENFARAASEQSWDWAVGQAQRFRDDGNTEKADHLLYQYKAKAASSLYHAMMHPLTQLPIAGMLWYQGERSQDNPPPYRTLFPAAIKGWRAAWNQGDFPFVFIQLPGYQGGDDRTRRRARGFPLVREAQEFALDLPNTGMAMALEFGNYEDVHPREKDEVGRRAGLQALRLMGADVMADGPVKTGIGKQYAIAIANGVKSVSNTATITFSSVADGLEARRVVMAHTSKHIGATDPNPIVVEGDAVYGFEVCGSDGTFVPADAKIVAPDQIELSAPDIDKIEHIRYAFAPFPECNLYNSAGLPARPFRTDTFDAPFGE